MPINSKNPLQSLRLSTTLALAFISLAGTVLFISSGFEIFFHFRTQQESISARQQLIARDAAGQVASYIREKFQVLESTVTLGELVAASEPDRKKALEMLLGLEPSIRHVAFLDPGNRELAGATRLSQAMWQDYSDRLAPEMAAKVMAGNRYIGSVHVDPLTSEPMVIVAVPVTDIFRDIRGVLAAEVNLKFMWNLVGRIKIGETGYAYVVDRNGDLIAHGDTGRVLQRENLSHLEAVSPFMEGAGHGKQNGVKMSKGINGDAIVGTYVPLGTPDWGLITEMPLREVFRPVITSVLTTVTIFLVTIVLAGFMGLMVARRLSDPIVHLTETASQITAGHMDRKAVREGPVEVADLAGAFNTMTARLKTLLAAEEERSRDLAREVASRIKTEAALKESEERLDLALSGANEGIWDWRIDRNTVFFDSRYYTMAGYAPGAFPGAFEEWEKRVHPDDIEGAKATIEQYLAGDLESYEVEFRFLREDGGYMWVRGKGKIVDRDALGSPVRFVGTHADISGQKAAEEALRDNEQLLANILESMDEGVLVLDSAFRCTIFNKTMELITNTSRREVLGKRPWEAFSFLRNSPVEENQRKAMAGEAAGSMEICLSLPYNHNLWVRDSFSPLKDGDGRIVGVVGVVSDITRRKRDEEELRRLRNYLANIIDSMPSVLVGVDREGRVTLWNKQAERITGLPSGQVVTQSMDTVFARLTDQLDAIKTAIQERRVIRSPRVTREDDDGTRVEDITIFPLVANGVEGAVIRVDDVTEKVRLEEMMIQSEKMLSVGGLAAGMAHEVNNPLASILLTADTLANRLGDRLDIPASRRAAEAAGTSLEAVERYMETRGILRMIDNIRGSGRRVAGIVENMLSFARKGNAVVSSQALDTLIDQTLELAAADYNLKKRYDFKFISIVREYASPLPAVPCEKQKIQQVLLNLFGNGAQAMQDAGVENPRFRIRTWLDRERQMVGLSIGDNGPGMTEETRRRVFEPFFTTKPVGVGTGLGLSVSYFIITEIHGGEMAVESSPGSGAKFIVRLPLEGKPK